MKRYKILGLAALAVGLIVGVGWATVDHWALPLENRIWPPDEHGARPYEVVSETAVHPYPCFIPHHFFRYYDDVGTLVAEIRVCFCCSGADAFPALFPFEGGVFLHPYSNSLNYDRERLGALIRSWGLPSDVWCRERAEPR